jgi:hypothetical protein
VKGAWVLLATLPACGPSRIAGVPQAPSRAGPSPPSGEAPSLASVPSILPLGAEEPSLVAALSPSAARALEPLVRRFLVRFAAEAPLPRAGRHVAAILLREPDPDVVRAAAGLLGRPAPPPLLRARVSPAEGETLARALLEPGSAHPATVSVALAGILAVGPQDRTLLLQALRTTDAPPPALLLSIGRCGSPEDAVDLRPYLQSGTVQRRMAAAAACAALGDSRGAALLQAVLEKGEAPMRREAVLDLALIGPEGLAKELLGAALADADPTVAAPAAIGLLGAGEGGAGARERFFEIARGSGLLVHPALLRTFRLPPPSPALLLSLLLSPAIDEETRVEAALGFGRRRDRVAGLLFRFGLERGALPEVCLAAQALASLEGTEATLLLLLRRVTAGEGESRAAAAFAIGEVGGRLAAEALARRLPRGDPAAAAAFLGAAAAQ